VRLVQTVDKSDFKLQAWIDKQEKPKSTFEKSKLFAIWKAAGRTLEQWDKIANLGLDNGINPNFGSH